MTLCSVGFKTMDKDGKHYERTEFTLGEHYMVVRNVVKYEDGTSFVNFSVTTNYEDRHDNYFPEIYYNDGIFGGEKEFTIQTTAYGSLSVMEVRKVIAGYQEALQAAALLNKNFC